MVEFYTPSDQDMEIVKLILVFASSVLLILFLWVKWSIEYERDLEAQHISETGYTWEDVRNRVWVSKT